MRRTLTLALAVALPAASAAAPPPGTRVLPLPVVAEGADAVAVAQVQTAVDDVLASLSEVERVPAAGPTFCAASDARCIADAGRRAGATRVLHVSARPVGDTVSLLLVLVSTGDGSSARVAETLRRGAAAGPVLRPALVRLLAPARFVGALSVEAPPGSRIWVDGVLAATAPAGPVQGLVPGQHLLRVVRPDGAEERRYVEVRFEETTSLRAGVAAPAPREGGGVLPALRVGALAAGGAALIAGLVAGASASSLRDEAVAAARTPVADPAHAGDLVARYEERRDLTAALYVTSAVLLVGAGALFALDLLPAGDGATLALRGAW